MTVDEKIKAFNDECRPFYIVDHGNGLYSLCLSLSMLSESCDYCHEAFDAFAIENGESPTECFYGSGYDWQAAFQEAYADDTNIGRILFDCECSGFFCDCTNLDILEDFGRRFKSICDDTEKFIPIVSRGMHNMAVREEEQRQLMNSVKGQLMSHPQATFDIASPIGNVRVTPEITARLLDGSMPLVKIEDTIYAAFELLDQPIIEQQTDLFDKNLIRMKTDDAPEPIEDEGLIM